MNTDTPLLTFDAPEALAEVAAATPAQLDELPFGVVRMDLDGRVNAYNRWESRLAGLSPERVLQRVFFEDVAPCTNNYLVSGRFFGEPALDVVMHYVFTLRMKPTPVRLRLLKAPGVPHMVLLVDR